MRRSPRGVDCRAVDSGGWLSSFVWQALSDGLAGGNLAFLSVDGVIALQGGLPIDVGGVVIGAVGVSGVTSAQDEQVAAAGIAALRP